MGWQVLSNCNAPNTASRRPSRGEGGEDEEDEEGEHWITCFDELLKVQHVKLTQRVEGNWQLTPAGREEMKLLVPMVSPCLAGEEDFDSCYKEFYRDFVAEHNARKKKEKEEAKQKRKEEKRKRKEEKEKAKEKAKEEEDKGKEKDKKKKKKKKEEVQPEKEKEKEEIKEEEVTQPLVELKLPNKAELLGALRELEANPPKLSEKQLERAYDEERNEYEEDEEDIKRKAKEVAALLRTARHCVVYSGAGISTSADIPDFRYICYCCF